MKQDRNPRNKPMHVWVPSFDKRGKNIQWTKDNLFNNGAGKTGQPLEKE